MTRETPGEIAACFDRLWPLLRSLTGEGVRQTHDILGELAPLERLELPSGTEVLDWRVPQEWVVREAYVVAPGGERILDVRENNLHLVNCSTAFRGRISREELDEHLYSLPDAPEAIPYVCSYYTPRWGFCLSQNQRDALAPGDYEVVVDCDHIDGSMTISEAVLPGESADEVLLSSYTCHPSLANNELSGPLVLMFLYRRLAQLSRRRLTYRFVLAPETIGAIAYLSQRGEHLLQHTVAGYVFTCLGMPGTYTYKKSRRGDSLADRAAITVLGQMKDAETSVREFWPSGSDERQYCSPGYNLPVGSIMRVPYGEFPEYHTSMDNRDLISFPAMVESVDACFEICLALDMNVKFKSAVMHGEPHYTKWGLAPNRKEDLARPGYNDRESLEWLLNLSDGEHGLLDISVKSGIPVPLLDDAARRCCDVGLLEEL